MRKLLKLISVVVTFTICACHGESSVGNPASSQPGTIASTLPTTALPLPAPPPNTPPANTSFIEAVISLTNQARASQGVAPLAESALLDVAAQGHAVDMATNHYFSHDSPNGSTPGDRILAAGYQWITWGENIAYGYATPEEAMQAWLNSPGHYANIMNPSFKEIGVGYYNTYWVQDFGAR